MQSQSHAAGLKASSTPGGDSASPGSGGPQPASSRRRYERKSLLANAFVHWKGSFQSVGIVDYSSGGLQLRGTFGLVERDHVEVELMSGERVESIVVWSLGSRTGLRFHQPLPTSHPFMSLLGRDAARC